MGNYPDLHISAEHPAFEGHFPGAPLLPGVLLLDEVLWAAQADGQWTIASAKFLHPVRPGETLTLEQERLSSGTIRFTVRSAGRPVATGTLIPGAGPEPSHGDETG